MAVNNRLIGWTALVGALTALSYGARAAGGSPAPDVLYRYSTAVGAIVQYAIVLGVVVAIAWGMSRRELGLCAPRRLAAAIGLGVVVLVATDIVGVVIDQFADPGKEQGLTPERWDPSRATPFALNFVVVVAVAPFVEELTFRGLGYALLARYGQWVAIVLVGVAFGLVHGLVTGLPILAFFGAALAWLRSRTESIYPGMAVHALFNAVALTLSVTT